MESLPLSFNLFPLSNLFKALILFWGTSNKNDPNELQKARDMCVKTFTVLIIFN